MFIEGFEKLNILLEIWNATCMCRAVNVLKEDLRRH